MKWLFLIGVLAALYTVFDPTALSAPILAFMCFVVTIIFAVGRMFGKLDRDIGMRRKEDRKQAGGTAGETWGPSGQDDR